MKARRLAFSVLPLLALLLLGECSARLAGVACEPITPSAAGWDTMVADGRTLWKLEPDRLFESPAGTTRTNSVGLRTALEPDQEKGEQERRVMVTGDSSVFGWGQPDGQSYGEQLEGMLSTAFTGVRVRVVNLGVPGFSTEQTLRLLEDVGWSYEPDLLVVHNIFSDCNIDAFQDRHALALADPEPKPWHASALYCACYMPWARYQATLGQEPNRVLMPGIPTGANQARRLEDIDQVIDLSRVPLEQYLENLDRLQGEAQERGATLLVAPLAQEWDVGRWTAPMDPPGPGQVLPWHPYRAAQAAWAQDRGVPQVLLSQAFRDSGVHGDSLFIDNMHPSVSGAWVMAKAVTEALRARPELLDLGPEHVARGWQPGAMPRDRLSGPPGGHPPAGQPPHPPPP